jgi:hypothetical protein
MFENFSGIEFGNETVCRKCMTHEETITAIRGFTDKLSDDAVGSKEYICSRCSNQIVPSKG